MTTEHHFFADDAHATSFLENDWQQRPRFLRAALTSLPELPDWRTLCADDNVESRRVITMDDRFALEHGPFEPVDPTSPWTVLIQDADYHAPALRALFHAVRLLPSWRLEDIMMSVATTGASVGPHVDAYDVFLVQARGRRAWDVGETGQYNLRHDDGDLRLVEPFAVSDRYEATPGDVLYLPPDVPHHGVATSDDCVTLSIGFRSPSLLDVAATLLAQASGAPRYRDPALTPATQPGLIDAAAIARLRAQLKDYAQLADTDLLEALGELVTEPKDWLAPDPRDSSWPSAASSVVLSAGARLAFGTADRAHWAFANGVRYPLEDAESQQFVALLASGASAAVPASIAARTLLEQLWEDGVVNANRKQQP
ncbi:MAG: cupin domain-containing protein [Gammaproteobacteria bacterium]